MARAADPAPSAFVREAAFVAGVGRLSDRDIARATGAAASTVRAWLARSRTRPESAPSAWSSYPRWWSAWPASWTRPTSRSGCASRSRREIELGTGPN